MAIVGSTGSLTKREEQEFVFILSNSSEPIRSRKLTVTVVEHLPPPGALEKLVAEHAAGKRQDLTLPFVVKWSS